MALFDNVKTTSQAESKVDSVEKTDTVETTVKAKTPKQIAWENARDKILAYISDEKNKVPADIVEAAKIFRPSYFGITNFGGGFAKKEHPAHVEKLFKLLGVENFEDVKVGASFDEMKAFTVLRVGRREMHIISIDLIKKPDAKGAIYLDFDAKKGIYTVKGVGNQPEDWKGYVPAKADTE